MTFAHPGYFLLLLFGIPIILWYALRRQRQEPTLRVADSTALASAPFSLRAAAVHLPFVLRMLVFVLAIVILARPQTSTAYSEREVEGIYIMIAMDISVSMLTQDLEHSSAVDVQQCHLRPPNQWYHCRRHRHRYGAHQRRE